MNLHDIPARRLERYHFVRYNDLCANDGFCIYDGLQDDETIDPDDHHSCMTARYGPGPSWIYCECQGCLDADDSYRIYFPADTEGYVCAACDDETHHDTQPWRP